MALCIFGMGTVLDCRGEVSNQQNKLGASSKAKFVTSDITKVAIDAKGLAALFEEYSGHRVVVADCAKSKKFSLFVSASHSEPKGYDEVIQLVKASGYKENARFELQPDGGSYILRHGLPDHRSGGYVPTPPIYSETNPMPQDDTKIVHYLMILKNTEFDDAKTILTQQRPIIQGRTSISDYQSFMSGKGPNEIVITDRVWVIRKMIELQKEFDKKRTEK